MCFREGRFKKRKENKKVGPSVWRKERKKARCFCHSLATVFIEQRGRLVLARKVQGDCHVFSSCINREGMLHAFWFCKV